MWPILIWSFVTLVVGAPIAAADPVTAKFSLSSPADAPPSQGADLLSRDLAEKQVMKLNLLPAGAIGRPSEITDLVRAGVIEMGLVPTDSLSKFNSGFAIFGLPFAFEDLGAVARFQKGDEGRKLLESLQSAGLMGLTYWPIEMDQLVADKSVKSAGDIKGLKVANAGSPLASPVFEALGASSAMFPAGELATALERGVADAAETGLSGQAQLSIAKRGKYLNYTNQRYRGSVLVANLQFWNRLSNEVKQKTMAAIDRITPQVDQLAAKQTAERVAALQRDGVQLIIPNASAFKDWRQIAEKTWLAKGGNKELFAAVGGAEGGGDPCGPGVCRCPDRTCSAACCHR